MNDQGSWVKTKMIAVTTQLGVCVVGGSGGDDQEPFIKTQNERGGIHESAPDLKEGCLPRPAMLPGLPRAGARHLRCCRGPGEASGRPVER